MRLRDLLHLHHQIRRQRPTLTKSRHLVEVLAALNRSFGRITPFKERFPIDLPERDLGTVSGEKPAHLRVALGLDFRELLRRDPNRAV